MINFVTPFSFAAEISGSVERAIQLESKKLVNPSPTFTPEENCDNCSESQQIETETKSSPTSTLSGADVKGIQVIPEPTPEKITKPIVKPVTSPSVLPYPSASISASPSAQPISEPVEQKQTFAIEDIWNWILKLFNSQA